MKDIAGQRYGKLTVIQRAENHITSGGYPVTMWMVRCDCGNVKVVRGSDLKAGRIHSCGCMIKEDPVARKHGGSGTKLYKIYHGMRSRCYNPKNKDYQHYGAKGVIIAPAWSTFQEFQKWAVENGYRDGLSIDRIDVDGNYSPDNCRWVEMREQHDNTTRTIRLTCNGVTKTIGEWASEIGISARTLRRRKMLGWEDEKIITTELKGSRE